ncbi:MAG: oxaloacetate decarboxylase [Betaproteobacteria bacterium]|nr:oxaloacetate decarboxylase [Betaproteobacteria bacterium]
MNHTEQRKRLRAVLAGSKCLSPASVYDPLSARVAETVGYELGMLAGSVASSTTLAAPDLIVLTLTEFADQIRRIMRASRLSLIVDADHGYGNALNVMRTIEELEHAGVSAMSIEDTALPARYGQAEGTDELISTGEMTGKLRAAVAARRDASLVIAGRTAALKVEGTEGAVARAKAYAATGVDAIFIVGLETLEQIEAIYAAVKLPIIVGTAPPSLKREDMAARGARILLQGHQPVAAAVKALHETYAHLYSGGAPADLKSRVASPQEMERLVAGETYRKWQREYLR